MNSTKEDAAGGQHRQVNHGQAGGNTGQRTIIRDGASKTALDVDEANGRGADAGKGDK
jgi:hypothetical protein